MHRKILGAPGSIVHLDRIDPADNDSHEDQRYARAEITQANQRLRINPVGWSARRMDGWWLMGFADVGQGETAT